MRYDRGIIVERKLIILCAIKPEAQAVARAMNWADASGGTVRCAGRPVAAALYTVGIGAGHVPAGLRADGVRGIVMAGLAGALDPRLCVGDVVMDAEGAVVDGVACRRGRILSSASIAATPAEKAELYRRTGAVAVEMENAKARAAAEAMGVPFVGIRAISDVAGEAVDAAVMGMVDEMGRPRVGRVLAEVVKRPGLVAQLWRLRKSTQNALGALGRVVRTVAERSPEWSGG